jgi:hypothetical protein
MYEAIFFSRIGPLSTSYLTESSNASDRLLAVTPWTLGLQGARQLAVDVNRAAAHAGDDDGFVKVQTREPALPHAPTGTGVLKNAKKFGLIASHNPAALVCDHPSVALLM